MPARPMSGRLSRCETATRFSWRPRAHASRSHGSATKVNEVKDAAQKLGRDIEVFTVGQVICRPTQKEADDYYQHAIIDNADWGAVDGMLANKSMTPQTMPRRGIRGQAPLLRRQRDRRLSVRRHARSHRRGTRRHQPGRRPRHRALLRQLSRRGALFLRRSAAAPGPPRRPRQELTHNDATTSRAM